MSSYDTSPTQHFECPDGAVLAYRIVGGPSPPARACSILAFNGAYCNTAQWRHAANLWASAGVRCILQDVRGSGESAAASLDEVRGQFTFDRYCEDAAALLQHLGIDKVVVVGMAWGARPALLFAARYPGTSEACVLYDLSLGNSLTTEHLGAQRYSLALARDKLARLGGLGEPPDTDKDFNRHADQHMAARAMAATSKKPYDDYLAFMEIAVDKVLCPTLVAMGEFDPNLVVKEGGARTVVERMRQRLPGAELRVLEAAGHASVRSTPLQCARAALDFLRRSGVAAPAAAL
uniref:AB hydrolase-1 domain-containing protein n=1 Tax=Alexandrium monilatum TaxID=311494 RepID=A0A7S4QP14_9DINO